jgi:hypothetical protein
MSQLSSDSIIEFQVCQQLNHLLNNPIAHVPME